MMSVCEGNDDDDLISLVRNKGGIIKSIDAFLDDNFITVNALFC